MTGRRHDARVRPNGFALIEAVVCVMLVALAMATAMAVAGQSARLQAKAADLATARLLADGLLADLSALPYEEPSATTLALGVDSGESSANKTLFDDVDDFNNWTESPPRDKDGTVLPGMTNWRRTVKIEWVTPTALAATASATETGVKRVTVTVLRGSVVVLTRAAVRTKSVSP